MTLHSPRFSRVLALGGIAALASVSLAACSGGGDTAGGEDCTPAHEFETIDSGVLTIASYDYPPSTLIEGDDSITGFEGDLLMQFAEENCLSVMVSAAGGAGAVIPSIETGRADIGAGSWYRTTERAEIVHLSEPTVIDASAIISTEGITVNDLDGQKIGSVSGNLWNESLQTKYGDNFTVYQDDESIYSDLAAGRIDVIVASAASAAGRLEDRPIEGATVETTESLDGVPEFDRPGQLTFPTSLENTELGEAIDAFVVEKREDGTIADVIEGYGLDPELADITEVWEL